MMKQIRIKEEIFSNPYEYRELIRELASGSQNEKLKNDCQKLAKIIEHSKQPEPVERLNLDITEIPASVTKRELALLEVNYEFSDAPYPTIFDAKNEKGELSYPRFSGVFEEEARKIAYFCNLSATNTYYRQQLIEQLSGFATNPNMSNEQTIACFRFLEFFASRSNSNSIYRNNLFPLIFNALVLRYRQLNAVATSADLYKIVPNIYYRLFGGKITKDDHVKGVMDNLAVQIKSPDRLIDLPDNDDVPADADNALANIII